MRIATKVSFDRLDKLRQKLERNEINGPLDDTLNEVASMWEEDAHEITGELKSSIGHMTNGYTGEVFANAEQAGFEVERGGLHDFTQRGLSIGERLLKERLEEHISG